MAAEMIETAPGVFEHKYPKSWFREHTRVKVWAYIIYTPDGFAILDTFTELSRFLAQYRITTAWWYNAPFDFAALDAAKLSSGWLYLREIGKEPKTYAELASPFGARYSMTERHPIDNRHDFPARSTKKTQKVTHYDLRNLLKGGLAKLLETFDVHDANGEPVRKRSMDYQSAGNESLTYDDLLYMLDDARGLWWLVWTFGKKLSEEYGLDIRGRKPDVMTASGLAKRLLLRCMYPRAYDDRAALKIYAKNHPIGLALDGKYRDCHLLAGGLVMLNPAIKGKPLGGAEALTMYRYDYNSHYPARMHDMPDITGHPRVYDGRCAKDRESDVRVFEISDLFAVLRPGFIPAWLDPIQRKVVDVVSVYGWRDGSVMLFDFELEELTRWYDIQTCRVVKTWLFNGKRCPGFAAFVDEHYTKKADAKAANDKITAEIEKLIQNGASGKFSQNPNHEIKSRQRCPDGVVRYLPIDPDKVTIESDENSLMNIVQGAWITAAGRTVLRQSCRKIAAQAGKTVAEVIYYTDTDSIHTTVDYKDTDPLRLGWLKRENKKPITAAIFTAPKTYAEWEDGEPVPEIHCKGVNTEVLAAEIERLSALGTMSRPAILAETYRPNKEYLSKEAMNVPGGKAILHLPKAVTTDKKATEEANEIYW